MQSKKCARTVCNNDHDNCKHTDYLGRLYCRPCAMRINRANPEVPNLISIPSVSSGVTSSDQGRLSHESANDVSCSDGVGKSEA